MKVMPTLEGGLRIDAEDEDDWDLLQCVIDDANGHEGEDLADRLGGMISEDAGAEDWRDFVIPDLREAFQDELAQVATFIETARFNAKNGAGPLWITPGDASAWYSALNQARLALEEEFRFGPSEDIDSEELEGGKRMAFIRSKFYVAIQGLLLEYVMR